MDDQTDRRLAVRLGWLSAISVVVAALLGREHLISNIEQILALLNHRGASMEAPITSSERANIQEQVAQSQTPLTRHHIRNRTHRSGSSSVGRLAQASPNYWDTTGGFTLYPASPPAPQGSNPDTTSKPVCQNAVPGTYSYCPDGHSSGYWDPIRGYDYYKPSSSSPGYGSSAPQ